ncbi:MAG: hypothetical protein II966_00535 [Lachnospiraceae bacterium]|nr:hypothetical protein [Lachnospiraceae bacterium]
MKEETGRETSKFSNLNSKQKLQYIWDYYKIPIIGGLILIYALTSFIHGRMTAKKTVFCLAMINSNATDLMDETLINDFSKTREDFDPIHQEMRLEADFTFEGYDLIASSYMQRLLAEYNVGAIDATISTKEVMEELASHQAFADLSAVLPEELFTKLQSEGYEIIYTDYEDPATNETHRFPFAVNISESGTIKKGFTDVTGEPHSYFDEDCYYALSPNSSYIDNGIAFLEYLLEN